MNKLTKQQLMNIYDIGKNLTDKPIFIDFYADWWGPCKMFEQVLNKVTPEYQSKINMYKVDMDKEGQIGSLFNVRGIPFMVMISKSGEREPQVGALDKDTLKYYFEGLLQKK